MIKVEPGVNDLKKPLLLWNNLLSQGTLTGANEAADGAVENAVTGTTWDFYTTTTAAGRIEVDFGTSTAADTAFITSHTLGTVGADITVEYWNGSIWVEVASTSPATDDNIMILWPQVAGTKWAIAFTGASGVFSVGVASLGRKLIIPGGILSGHVALNHSKQSELLVSTSLTGHNLNNRVISEGIETRIDFGLMPRDFVEGDFLAFKEHYNQGNHFAFCGGPANYPDNLGWCWRPMGGGTISPGYREGGALMDVSMDVSAYVA